MQEVTVATVDASADPPTVTFSKPGGPYGGFYNDLLTSLAPHLPRGMRVKLLMNAMDEPRRWVGPPCLSRAEREGGWAGGQAQQQQQQLLLHWSLC